MVVPAGSAPSRRRARAARRGPCRGAGAAPVAACEVVDQVEHRRLGPVQVLERDDERPARGDAREHAAKAPEELVDGIRGVGQADRRRSALRRGRVAVRERVELRAGQVERVVVVHARELAERLGDRPERDALAVGEAAAARHGGSLRRPLRGTRRRGATCRRRPRRRSSRAGPIRRRRRHRAPRGASRAPRRGRRAGERSRGAAARPRTPSEPERRHRLGLALELERLDRLEVGDGSTRSRVSEPISTSLVPAACSSRAATLTASPVTSRWPAAGSPDTTSPVFTPVRFWSVTPKRASSSAFSPASAACIPAAARTARSASSSCRCGRPNTAITASPMNFSTVPPWRLELLAHDVEVARHDRAERFRVERARRWRSSRRDPRTRS